MCTAGSNTLLQQNPPIFNLGSRCIVAINQSLLLYDVYLFIPFCPLAVRHLCKQSHFISFTFLEED